MRTTLLGTNGGVVAKIGEGETFAVVSTKKNADELLDELFEAEETVLGGDVVLLKLLLIAPGPVLTPKLELELNGLELDIALEVVVVVVVLVVGCTVLTHEEVQILVVLEGNACVCVP